MRAGQVVDRSAAILAPTLTAAEARIRIATGGGDAWLVADDRRFLGRLRADRLAAARPGETVASLLEPGGDAVAAETRLDAVVARVAAEDCLAVVDPDGLLIGAVGSRDVVWPSIQRLEAGTGFEAGLDIVILAVILDRSTQALAERARPHGTA